MPQYQDKATKKWYYEFNYKTASGETKRRKKRGFELKKDAKEAEDAERMRLKKDPPSKMTFGQLYKLYVEAKENEWLPNTRRKVTTGIELHILPHFKNMVLEKITSKDIEDWKTSMYNKKTPGGEKYKMQSLNCIRGYLNALFNYAVNHRYIIYNPAKAVRGFKDPAKTENQEKTVWSKKEFIQFINHVDDEHWKAFFTFLWFTGLRIGEAQGVTFKDIDFENNTVSINKSIDTKQKGKPYAVNPTKTKKKRMVDLPDSFMENLKSYCEKQKAVDGWTKESFLFGLNKPLPNTTIDKARNKYIEASGVKYISSHGFRHSHATYLLSEGVDVKSVAERLGHRDVVETLNTYAHVLPDSKDKILKLLEASVE